jgi:molecular chaperone GrpE
MSDHLRDLYDRVRGRGSDAGRTGAVATESSESKDDPTTMSQTGSKVTDEQLEGVQNTDPVSDPLDDLTTGVDTAPETVSISAVDEDENGKLRAERDALIDRLARLQAEFENARRRADREKQEFREYAVSGAIEQFLPVLDNFNLALKSTGSAEQLRTGVELIVKQMEEVLRGLNVQTVETTGTQFDPRFHEALDSVAAPDLPDGQVYEEVRRGYRIKERLLRPALVRVVSNPQQKSE